MKEFFNKILSALKKFNEKVDNLEDKAEGKLAKENKVKNNVSNFFSKGIPAKIITVISWILFAFIIYLSLTFISHPMTFILFLILALIVMPTFNSFLRKKEIKIALWKKWLLFIVILFITILTAPIDENGEMYKGIEGIDFKIGKDGGLVVLNNEELKVVTYAVNYYYDNVLVTSEKYEANLYDVITFYEDKSQDGKYELVTENNFPLEINSENLKDNIINIYYRTPKEEPKQKEVYTVEDISTKQVDDDYEEVVTEEEISWSMQTFEASTYEEVRDMLGKDIDSSTKYVVYTVQYIFDGEIDDNLTDYFVVPLGSRVQTCEIKEKESFKYKETENCPLEVNDNNQKIKVKYEIDKKSTEEENTSEETEVEEAKESE